MGDLNVSDYCQKLKSVSDLLTNIGAPVPEKTLVSYLIDGLTTKYDHIATVMRHCEPLPSFLQARSMLSLEENPFNRVRSPQPLHSDHSSSTTALHVDSPNNAQVHADNSQPRGAGPRSNTNRRGNNSSGQHLINSQTHGGATPTFPHLINSPPDPHHASSLATLLIIAGFVVLTSPLVKSTSLVMSSLTSLPSLFVPCLPTNHLPITSLTQPMTPHQYLQNFKPLNPGPKPHRPFHLRPARSPLHRSQAHCHLIPTPANLPTSTQIPARCPLLPASAQLPSPAQPQILLNPRPSTLPPLPIL